MRYVYYKVDLAIPHNGGVDMNHTRYAYKTPAQLTVNRRWVWTRTWIFPKCPEC